MGPTELDKIDKYNEYVDNIKFLETEEKDKPESRNLREALNIVHKKPKWLKDRR
jgi:hypothetical protein